MRHFWRLSAIIFALMAHSPSYAQIGPGGGGGGGSSAITTWGGAALAAATAWGVVPSGNVIGANVNCLAGCIGTSGTPTIVDETTSSQFHTDLTAPSTGLAATTATTNTYSNGTTSQINTDLHGGLQLRSDQLASQTNPAPVISGAATYKAVAASQTATVLGATGAIGDYLSHCDIYPTSTSPGVVTVFDNTNAAASSVILFPGGASSISNLVPFAVPVGALSTAGGWKVTTGSAVSVVCYGRFT